jgi:hypothetical protein
VESDAIATAFLQLWDVQGAKLTSACNNVLSPTFYYADPLRAAVSLVEFATVIRATQSEVGDSAHFRLASGDRQTRAAGASPPDGGSNCEARTLICLSAHLVAWDPC